jgi:hypothetical protein
MKSDNSGWIILGLGVVIVAALFLFSRKPGQTPAPVVQQQPTRWVPVPTRHYVNTETTEITWNDDGYPVKIVRHRDATQA